MGALVRGIPLGTIWERSQAFERSTRPRDPEVTAALERRWLELPEHVKTPAQLIGRRITGCEGTQGVFPRCSFACKPCYHSRDANRVRVDGAHTTAEVERQMAYLRKRRGPGQYAQLIGGEVSLLSPEDHAEALEVMLRYERKPMSFTHGDFDYDYLERLAVRADGSRRFRLLSFAAHFDRTMRGRRGLSEPTSERELNPYRERFCAMFDRLRREHGVRAHLAHNMTVTPENLGELASVIRDCRAMGFRVFSFQPAAYVGDERRWGDGFRSFDDDAVWAEIERGAGTRLPHGAVQVGDLRCNRAVWGVYAGEQYHPLFDDRDARDLRARDAFYTACPRAFHFGTRAQFSARLARATIANRRCIPPSLSWSVRMGRRVGPGFLRGDTRAVAFVMHSFIDARDVAPAWELLQRGETSEDPRIRAAQERLSACAYGMAHPELDEIVPACVQHSVLDARQNATLAQILPLHARARHEDTSLARRSDS